MKHPYIIILTLILSVGTAFGQGELDAYKISKNELQGTARSMSMGGAFGALGGNISGIAINPAGIGVYTGTEIVGTLNFQNSSYEANMMGLNTKKSTFKTTFENAAVVISIPTPYDEMPRFNMGFSSNKLKDFNRKFTMNGKNLNNSLADYMAVMAGNTKPGDFEFDKSNYYSPFKNQNWLGTLGYNAFLISPASDGYYDRHELLPDQVKNNSLRVRESGNIYSFDMNMGAEIANLVSFGLTMSVTDINYRLHTDYSEDFLENRTDGGYNLRNFLQTKGDGFQVKTGVILKPINELRIGIAYHSPTWYRLTDRYETALNYDLRGIMQPVNPADVPIDGSIDSGEYKESYKLRTPDKWTFSLATVIAHKAILSVDYELTNYKSMKLSDDNSYRSFEEDNKSIKQDFKNSSMLRIGGEYRITPNISGRVGYAWQQSPLQKDFKNNDVEAYTAGSISHLILDGDTNYYTWGVGYNFNPNKNKGQFYIDLGFVASTQKDFLYSFSNVYNDLGEKIVASDRATLKVNKFQGVLTVGFKIY